MIRVKFDVKMIMWAYLVYSMCFRWILHSYGCFLWLRHNLAKNIF